MRLFRHIKKIIKQSAPKCSIYFGSYSIRDCLIMSNNLDKKIEYFWDKGYSYIDFNIEKFAEDLFWDVLCYEDIDIAIIRNYVELECFDITYIGFTPTKIEFE